MKTSTKLNQDHISRAATIPISKKPAWAARSNAISVGLEILEYIAASEGPPTRLDIAKALNLSGSMVYRFLITLENRGYIVRAGEHAALTPTAKLLDLQPTGFSHQRLLTHARRIMQSLSNEVRQSCNLAIPCLHDMRVVAQEDAPGPFGIRVPVGHRYDVPSSAPGVVFAAFMRHSDPEQWPQSPEPEDAIQPWSSLKAEVQKAEKTGFARCQNLILPDVTDLSCPVIEHGQFVAALTVPYIKTQDGPPLAWCLAAVQRATEHLSQSLHSDIRVA